MNYRFVWRNNEKRRMLYGRVCRLITYKINKRTAHKNAVGRMGMRKDQTDIKIEGILFGQVDIYCEQINTGTKLCAQMMFEKKYLKAINKTVKRNKCKVTFRDIHNGTMVAYIYKYGFVKLIIAKLFIKKCKGGMPCVFEVWAAGKLFGYSDYEISKYLKAHGYLGNAA